MKTKNYLLSAFLVVLGVLCFLKAFPRALQYNQLVWLVCGIGLLIFAAVNAALITRKNTVVRLELSEMAIFDGDMFKIEKVESYHKGEYYVLLSKESSEEWIQVQVSQKTYDSISRHVGNFFICMVQDNVINFDIKEMRSCSTIRVA